MQTDSNLSFNPIETLNKRPGLADTYGFIPTRVLLDTLANKGWNVESTQYARVRKLDRSGYQRHVVWLSNPMFGPIEGLTESNATVPRLCLVNSHDGTSAFHLFFGFMRLACLNQLGTGKVFRHLRVIHNKDAVKKLDTGIDWMVEGLPEVVATLSKLQNKVMPASQIDALAKHIFDIRLKNVHKVKNIDYSVIHLARRNQDQANDAYTVINRAQELVLRGGIPFTYERTLNKGTPNERVIDVHTFTRKAGGIGTTLALNEAVFEAAKGLVA